MWYFFHVPKAGGISVNSFLRANLRLCNDELIKLKPWLEGEVKFYNGCCDMPVYEPLMKLVEAMVTNEGRAYEISSIAEAKEVDAETKEGIKGALPLLEKDTPDNSSDYTDYGLNDTPDYSSDYTDYGLEVAAEDWSTADGKERSEYDAERRLDEDDAERRLDEDDAERRLDEDDAETNSSNGTLSVREAEGLERAAMQRRYMKQKECMNEFVQRQIESIREDPEYFPGAGRYVDCAHGIRDLEGADELHEEGGEKMEFEDGHANTSNIEVGEGQRDEPVDVYSDRTSNANNTSDANNASDANGTSDANGISDANGVSGRRRMWSASAKMPINSLSDRATEDYQKNIEPLVVPAAPAGGWLCNAVTWEESVRRDTPPGTGKPLYPIEAGKFDHLAANWKKWDLKMAVFVRNPILHVVSMAKHDMQNGKIKDFDQKLDPARNNGYSPSESQTRHLGGGDLDKALQFLEDSSFVGLVEFFHQSLSLLKFYVTQKDEDRPKCNTLFEKVEEKKFRGNVISKKYMLNSKLLTQIVAITQNDTRVYARGTERFMTDYNAVCV
jgi:hypothetical protein